MTDPAETQEFWLDKSQELLAATAAALHIQRRELHERVGYNEVMGARTALSSYFIPGGIGVEVGAGNRPFPVPDSATVLYGDIRDRDKLRLHFADQDVQFGAFIDAETFAGVKESSLDFIISAHVIEHLANPFGSIKEGLARLQTGGVYLIVIPDMRLTTDRDRPSSTFEHLMGDFDSGGADTLLASYVEHCRFVHPLSMAPYTEEEIMPAAEDGLRNRVDIHVHTWTRDTFADHLARLALKLDFSVVFNGAVQNEALFVLRRN